MAGPKPRKMKPITKHLPKAKLASKPTISVLRNRVRKANTALDTALHRQERGMGPPPKVKRTPPVKGIDKGGPSKSIKTGRISGWYKKGKPTSKRKSGGSK